MSRRQAPAAREDSPYEPSPAAALSVRRGCDDGGGVTTRVDQSVTGDDSDAALARRTAAGDREAFAALYARHHGRVLRFARLMTGSTTASEDVVQDVFLALMRQADQYDAARGSLPTYLYAIARHQVRHQLIRQRRITTVDPALFAESETLLAAAHQFVDLARTEALHQVRRAVLTLPSRYREVVVLCDIQEVSYADAALALGCAVGTVRSRLHRARQLLSAKLSVIVAPEPRQTRGLNIVRCVV